MKLTSLRVAAAMVIGAGVFTGVPAGATATVPTTAAATTVVVGPAGAVAHIRITQTAALNNAGWDVKLSARHAKMLGLLIVRTDHQGKQARNDFYLETFGTDLGACPDSPTCPVPAFLRAWVWGADSFTGDNSGRMHLHPGDYAVVLLSDTNERVTARIHFANEHQGTRTVSTGDEHWGTVTNRSTTSVRGKDLAGQDQWVDWTGHGLMFSGYLAMISWSAPGAASWTPCVQFGWDAPSEPVSTCVGGAPGAPTPLLGTEVSGGYFASVSPFGVGDKGWYYNWGYTATAAGAKFQHLTVASYTIRLPV